MAYQVPGSGYRHDRCIKDQKIPLLFRPFDPVTMKRILLIALLLLCTVGSASAYGVYLSCNSSIQVGAPLKCSLDSDYPPGTTFNVVLYQTQYTATQIQSQPITVQADHSTQYFVADTTGLPGGNYKVEVQFTGPTDQSEARSDSITLQLVTLVDRSGQIELSSPLSQNLDEALMITGDIQQEGNNGVQIEVIGPDGTVFGPQWIQTQSDIRTGAGDFTQTVHVNSGGNYKVDFTDANGFIGEKMVTVVAPSATTVPIPTYTAAVVKPTFTVPTVPTPWPTTTPQSPLPSVIPVAALACAGIMAVMGIGRSRK
jgi:hypothetical protein